MSQLIPKMYFIFIDQDYENEYFDVIFDVQGKVLYAHSGILAAASPVFKQLIIKNRSTPNQSIRIDGYSFDEFYEFLKIIYFLGDYYDFDDPYEEYIFAIIEVVHIYEIDEIKENFVNVLATTLLNCAVKDAFKIFEVAYKYLFAKKEIEEFINRNFNALIQYTDFINLVKSVIQAFVYYGRNIYNPKVLCDAIMKWGKHQAMITLEMSEEDKNDLILYYIKDFLPYFSLKYLLEFFVNEKGLISVNDAKKVKTIQVTVTCKDKSISGSFVDSYGIFEYIKSHENEKLSSYRDIEQFFWGESFDIPLIPSKIQKRENIEWCLLINKYKILSIKHYSIIEENDYLIAELKASKGNETDIDGNGFMINQEDDVFATVSRKYEQIFCLQ